MRRTQKIIAPALLGILALSCTVKEDRLPCPCVLTVDTGRIAEAHPEALRDEVGVAQWAGGLLGCDTVIPEENPLLERDVPKGTVTLTTFTGTVGMKLEGGTLAIPEGSQCDSLWACTQDVPCLGERAAAEPVLRKNFATVTFTMATDPGETYTYTLRARGTWAGVSLKDLSPVAGRFEHLMTPSGAQGNVFSVRVPRQGDGSLEVDVMRPGGETQTFPVGEMILERGFRWDAVDLGDIGIDLDHDRVVTGVTIVPWRGIDTPFNKL